MLDVEGVWLLWWLPVAGMATAPAADEILLGVDATGVVVAAAAADVVSFVGMPFCLLSDVTGAVAT